jgi:hypothetical protein
MYISNKYSLVNFNAVRNTTTDKNYQKLIKKISKNDKIFSFENNCNKQKENPIDVYFRKGLFWKADIIEPGVARKIVMIKKPFISISKFTEAVFEKTDAIKKHIFPAL